MLKINFFLKRRIEFLKKIVICNFLILIPCGSKGEANYKSITKNYKTQRKKDYCNSLSNDIIKKNKNGQ